MSLKPAPPAVDVEAANDLQAKFALLDKRACVIGAGFGGLALAIRLQSAGVATTIVEARDKPGGQVVDQIACERDQPARCDGGGVFRAGGKVVQRIGKQTDKPGAIQRFDNDDRRQGIGFHSRAERVGKCGGWHGVILRCEPFGEPRRMVRPPPEGRADKLRLMAR